MSNWITVSLSVGLIFQEDAQTTGHGEGREAKGGKNTERKADAKEDKEKLGGEEEGEEQGGHQQEPGPQASPCITMAWTLVLLFHVACDQKCASGGML